MCELKSCDNILYVIRKDQTFSPDEFHNESPNLKPCCKVDEFAENENQDFHQKFLKTVHELSILIVRILITVGIKKCHACKSMESIKHALLYYDGVPHKQMCTLKKRIRKATLFNKLGRDAKMSIKEASLTYMILKNIFKVFYNTVGVEGETGFAKFSIWSRTVNRIAANFNQDFGQDPQLAAKMMCLVKKFLVSGMKSSCCESLEVPTKCFNLDCPSCYKNLTKQFYGKPTMDGFSVSSNEKIFFNPGKMDEEILKNNGPNEFRRKKNHCCPECEDLKTPCGDDLWNPPKYTKKVQPTKKMRCRPKTVQRTTSEKVSIKFICEAMTPSDQSLENPCCNFEVVKCKQTDGAQNRVQKPSVETVQCGDLVKIEKRTPSSNKCHHTYTTDFVFCDCKKDLDAKKSSTQVIDKLLSGFIIELMDHLGISREGSEQRIHSAFMKEWEIYARMAEEAEQAYNAVEEQKDYKCGGLKYFEELKAIDEKLRIHGGWDGGFLPADVRILKSENGNTELQVYLIDREVKDLSVLKVFSKGESKMSMFTCEPFLFSKVE